MNTGRIEQPGLGSSGVASANAAAQKLMSTEKLVSTKKLVLRGPVRAYFR